MIFYTPCVTLSSSRKSTSEDQNSICLDLDKAQLKELGEKLNREKKHNPFIYWGDIPEVKEKKKTT